MRTTIRLNDETMEGIRASEAFRALDPGVGESLEEFLYNEFGGANDVSGAQAVLRLDRYLGDVLADPVAIREVVLSELGAA